MYKLDHTEGSERASPLSVGAHEHGVYVGLEGPSHTRDTGRPRQCGRGGDAAVQAAGGKYWHNVGTGRGAPLCVTASVPGGCPDGGMLDHSVGTGRVSLQCGASCGSSGNPGWPGDVHTLGTGMVKGHLTSGGSFGVAAGKVGGQRFCHIAHTQRAGHLNGLPDAL